MTRNLHSDQTAPDPQSAKRAKIGRALALTDGAGITRGHSWPPGFRLMAKFGWHLQPLHYRSALWLLIYHFVLIGFFFSLLLGPYLLGILPAPDFWPINKLVARGWSTIVLIATFVAVVTTAFIKWQAKRAKLPAWEDV